MSETVLTICLLNERLSATAVHRDEVAGTWERPEPVTDLADFASVLREAIERTGYTGTAVSVVLAHQRLAQQLVETPPVKGRNLKLFLQSRVKQLKPFTSEAAWSYQAALPTRNAQATLLHLLPRELLDQLVQGCQQLELQCARVVPASAILQRQLAELPLEPNEVALLAADTGGTFSSLTSLTNCFFCKNSRSRSCKAALRTWICSTLAWSLNNCLPRSIISNCTAAAVISAPTAANPTATLVTLKNTRRRGASNCSRLIKLLVSSTGISNAP